MPICMTTEKNSKCAPNNSALLAELDAAIGKDQAYLNWSGADGLWNPEPVTGLNPKAAICGKIGESSVFVQYTCIQDEVIQQK